MFSNWENDVIKLLYRYKYLNFTNLSNLSKINLIVHRVRLVSKTKPHFVKQKRWLFHKEWWLRKLVQNEINEGVYERIKLQNDKQLSSWNARAVLIDKTENPEPNDKPRMTYDYFRVIEQLSRTHMSLMFECHDYLSNFRHKCFMTADLKHVYFGVLVHSDDREFFAFIISSMSQLQSIKMQQGFQTTSFIMSELMTRAFEEIFEESFLFQNITSNKSSLITYYQDDIMGKHESFQKQFNFFRDHFLFKIEWTRLCLFFKKLFFFQFTIRALGMQHHMSEQIIILKDRIKKIVRFSISQDKIDIRAFLRTIKIIRQWVSNFAEINRSFIKLIEKSEWRWIKFEALAFEILRVKCTTVSTMFKYNYSLSAHFYTDVFKYACELAIIQF